MKSARWAYECTPPRATPQEFVGQDPNSLSSFAVKDDREAIDAKSSTNRRSALFSRRRRIDKNEIHFVGFPLFASNLESRVREFTRE